MKIRVRVWGWVAEEGNGSGGGEGREGARRESETSAYARARVCIDVDIRRELASICIIRNGNVKSSRAMHLARALSFLNMEILFLIIFSQMK